MQGAKKRLLGAVLLIISVLRPVAVYGEEAAELPKIVSWQNGAGYQEDGTQITGGWAYDTVNPAGRYVWFGEDGSVLLKTENLESVDAAEEFTGTELVQATLALRAEVFEGFEGTVTVFLEGNGGISKQAVLEQENFYSFNIAFNSGDYRIVKVEATDGLHSYITQFSDSAVHLSEKGMRVLKIRVTDQAAEETKTADEGERAEYASKETENPQKAGEETKTEGGEQTYMEGKKMAAILGSIGGLCLAGMLLLRKRRKKYS